MGPPTPPFPTRSPANPCRTTSVLFTRGSHPALSTPNPSGSPLRTELSSVPVCTRPLSPHPLWALAPPSAQTATPPPPGWRPRCHLLTGFSLPAIANLKPSLGFTLRLSSQLWGTLPEGRAPALPSLPGPCVQMRPGQLEAPSSGSICRVIDGGLSRPAGS